MAEAPADCVDRAEAILADLPAFAGTAATLHALAEVTSAQDLPALLRGFCADHPSPKVRFNAERALRQLPPRPPPADLGNPPDPRQVGQALQSEDPELRLAGASALPRLEVGRAQALLARTLTRGEPDSWVLATLLALAGELGGEGMSEHAALHLDHASPRVEANALHALHRLAPRLALHAAYERLGSEDNRVRGNAVLALAPFNPGVAWRHVREMGLSEDPWMRASACYLAAHLGHDEAERLLLEVLRRERHPELILRVVHWLAGRGTAAAAGPLAYLVEFGAPALAVRAQDALEKIRARTTVVDEALEESARAFGRRRIERLPSVGQGPPTHGGARQPAPGPAAGSAPCVPPSPSPAAPSLFEPLELVAELAGEVEDRAGEGALDASIRKAYHLLRYADGEAAVDLLQGLLDEDGGEVPARVRCALALALISIGETGLAAGEVARLSTDGCPLDELYALARALEEMGSHDGAGGLYEGIRSRRLRYRDVGDRLASLARHPDALKDRVRVALAQNYRDLEPLGQGGMGQVFHAVHRARGEAVALKVPDLRLLADDVTRERFRRECQALAAIQHPNVVRVLEVAEGEVPYLAMELVPGRSLEEVLHAEAPMPAGAARALLGGVARALEAVHGAGIVHRDLKPANVLLGEDGRPRLADFGVAFVGQEQALTNTGMLVGTVAYMAPEQISGQLPSPAADVYAFGVLLYQALAGALPFEGANAMAKIYRDAPRLRAAAPGVPEDLDALAASCLAREPEQRPPDGGALVAALAREAGR